MRAFNIAQWPALASFLLRFHVAVAKYSTEFNWDLAARGRELVQVRQDVGRADSLDSLHSTWLNEAHEELHFQPFRYFPALPLSQPVAACSKIGRQYPELVSRNRSILARYASIVCDDSRDASFLTDPAVPLTAEMAEFQGGCVNMNRWATRSLAFNSTHSVDIGRTCGNACKVNLSHLMPTTVDDDVLVISTTRLPIGMEYQHLLLDFLPGAWTATRRLKSSSMKLVTHVPLQKQIMRVLGVAEDQILELPFPKEGKFLLCTRPEKTLSLWRTGRSNGEPLQTKRNTRGVEDFWHRLIAFRVGPELSKAVAKGAKLDPWQPTQQVTFLNRCVPRRPLINEDEALAVTSKALINAKRREELVSMCAGRRSWLEQVNEIRKSVLLIGAHGGSIANAVFALHGTGLIEIVNSPDAHNATESGRWPPYKSHWYGGAGAALSFFRVVLYERNAANELEVRTDDLEEALHQWFAYKAA